LSGLSIPVTIVNHPDEHGTVGEPHTIICNKSTNGPVHWWYRSHPDADIEHVSFGEGTLNGFKGRCFLDADNLVFKELDMNDTGIYTCLEEGGYGVRHVTYLTVSGN